MCYTVFVGCLRLRGSTVNTDVKFFATTVEDECKKQVETLASCPAFEGAKIRIMPDCHSGKGCVIGFTANLGDKCIPNVIGVDIGCGMYVCKLSTPVRDFEWFDKVVRQVVPMGFSLQDRRMCRLSDYNFTCTKKLKNKDRLEMSLGTLGGGNHFVELDEDNEGNQYLVVHSGSRNLGLQVCNIYQQRAKNAHEGEVPKDLEYLDGTLKDDYVHDMKLAQKFAVANREEMVKHICGKGQLDVEWSFHTVHNYLGDDNVIRKGAISANKGEVVYIPLNMRDGGIIAVGKGNSEWNNSAPHGAGRLMSRAKARDVLSVDEFKRQMTDAHVWSSSVCEGTIDEAPGAYKPVEEILSVIGDTVEVVNTVRPVYNAKAVDSGRR